MLTSEEDSAMPAADNALREAEVESGIAGAAVVSNYREKTKAVSWDLQLAAGSGAGPVIDEPRVVCIVKDETSTDWSSASVSVTLPQSTSIGVLYSEVAKMRRYVEGTFLLSWKRPDSAEDVLGENSTATMFEMGMHTHPAKNTFHVKQKDGVQPQVIQSTEERSSAAGSSSLVSTATVSTTLNSTTYSSGTTYWSGYHHYFGKSDTGFVGLINQAMTCYLNSLLQTLYMTPEFRNALYRWKYTDVCNREACSGVVGGRCVHLEANKAKCIPYQLQRLFLLLQMVDKRAVETTDVTKSFGWDSSEAWQQHDVQELCRVMFDALEKMFKHDKDTDSDLINDLFKGELKDYVKCSECSNESARADSFLDISLPIKPFGSEVTYKSVEESLRSFVQPEILDGDNQYSCEKCGRKCDAHKGLKFTKLPYLLMLQLKRFDFDYSTQHRIKLNDRMTFPKILDLNSFVGDLHHQKSVVEDDTPVDLQPVMTKSCEPDSPTIDSPSSNSLPSTIIDSSSTTITTYPSFHDDSNPETPPPPYSDVVGQSSLANEDDQLNNRDASFSAGNPLWMSGEGPSSSNKVEDLPSEQELIDAASKNGPYVYELYSIMIHSGSAIGGHYYAYIKSFTDKKWYCFNDQSVTTVSEDDIERSYGGSDSGSRGYYSSMYASSANAYMLVYRTVQPEKNSDFIKTDQFPDHLMEQLQQEKQREKDEKEREELDKAMCKLTLHAIHPEKKIRLQENLSVYKDRTLKEATAVAHKLLGFGDVVPMEQCRLVKYDDYSETMEQSYDGQEDRPFSVVVGGVRQYYTFDLFLEVRGKDDKFRIYKPGGISIKVLVIDLETEQVLPPTTIRGEQDWTVKNLREVLKTEFKLEGSVVRVVLEKYYSDLKLLESDDVSLKQEMFYRTSKVYLECSNTSDHSLQFEQSLMHKLIDKHMNSIVLIINYPSTVIESSVDKESCTVAEVVKTMEKTTVLTVDKRITLGEVKKQLEPQLKLESNQFKLYRVYSNNQEFEMTRTNDTFSSIPTETKLNVKLGRALNPGEYRVKTFLLRIGEAELSKYLVETVCAKGSTLADFKKQIFLDMAEQKVEEAKDITLNRMRVRKKMWRSPATIYLDHMIIDKDVQVYSNCEMYIEILKDEEVMKLSSQMQVYIRRWNPSTYTIGSYDEIILTDATPNHLKQKIAEKGELPLERVEFAKGIGSFPCDVSPLEVQDDLDWNPQITSINAWPLSLYDDGGVLYYRDSQEKLGELSTEHKAKIQKDDNARLNRMNYSTGTTTTSSKYYRKEKALKIYTADDDYKKDDDNS